MLSIKMRRIPSERPKICWEEYKEDGFENSTMATQNSKWPQWAKRRKHVFSSWLSYSENINYTHQNDLWGLTCQLQGATCISGPKCSCKESKAVKPVTFHNFDLSWSNDSDFVTVCGLSFDWSNWIIWQYDPAKWPYWMIRRLESDKMMI